MSKSASASSSHPAIPAHAMPAPQRVKRHVISALVKNVPGLLAQVANLFAARGYNIESLTVAETESADFSRMTICVRADEEVIAAMERGLKKFIAVIKVLDFTGINHVERDLALIKLTIPAGARQEILALIQVFGGKVVDMGLKDVTIELAGPEAKIDAFLNIVRPYGIIEMARTGRVAIARGSAMEGQEVEP